MSDNVARRGRQVDTYLMDESVGAFEYEYLDPNLNSAARDMFPRAENAPIIRQGSPIGFSGNTHERGNRNICRVSSPIQANVREAPGLEASIHAPRSTFESALPEPIVAQVPAEVVEVPAEVFEVPFLEVERVGLSTAPQTWTALPKWSMKHLFVNEQQARAAEGYNTGNPSGAHRSPVFAGAGLRYIPSENDCNVYRTVVVEGLSPYVTIHEVLSHVEGGKIELVVLCDTRTMGHGYRTMYIQFVLQSGAQEFLRRTHGALFLEYWPTQVRQVGTPTYPLSPTMDKHINLWGRTRVLKIHSEHVELRAYLRQEVLCEPEWAECVVFTQENVLAGTTIIHFTSIKRAIEAYHRVRATQPFADSELEVEFHADPCAV